MNIKVSKAWCVAAALKEGNEEVGVGLIAIDPAFYDATDAGETGYRQLSEAEVELMDEGKAIAEACGIARPTSF